MNFQKNMVILVYSLLLSFLIFITPDCKILYPKKLNTIENNITKKLLKFSDISSKCLITYQAKDKNLNLIADFVCFYDSLIYFNIKLPFGISSAKLLFKPDSTYFNNELNNQVLKFSTQQFFKKYNLPVNYKTIQSILFSEIFVYPDNNSFNNYTITKDSLVHLSYIKKQANYPYFTIVKHNIHIMNNLVKNFAIEDYNTYTFVNCKYEYQTITNKYFTKVLYLQIIQKDTVFIKIKFKNVKINNNPDFSF